METAFVTLRNDEQLSQTLAVVPPLEAQPELSWTQKFPGTAGALDRINAALAEKRHALEAQRKEEAVKAEARRVQNLSRTKEGRAELAALALKQLKEREAAAHSARIAEGKGSAASDANKAKRATRRAAAVAAAQANKAFNQSQGRGGKR